MSLFDIYKAKQLGAGAGSLFDAKAGGKLNKDAWKKGFNKWDEQWELGGLDANGSPAASSTQIRSKNYIPVVGGETYYIKTLTPSGVSLFQYDSDKNYITRQFLGNTTITLPANIAYLKFRTPDGITSYTEGICINISGEHNGEYVPYNE